MVKVKNTLNCLSRNRFQILKYSFLTQDDFHFQNLKKKKILRLLFSNKLAKNSLTFRLHLVRSLHTFLLTLYKSMLIWLAGTAGRVKKVIISHLIIFVNFYTQHLIPRTRFLHRKVPGTSRFLSHVLMETSKSLALLLLYFRFILWKCKLFLELLDQ